MLNVIGYLKLRQGAYRLRELSGLRYSMLEKGVGRNHITVGITAGTDGPLPRLVNSVGATRDRSP